MAPTGNNPALSIIGACLSLAPVPHLNVAFSTFSTLWSAVENTRWSNQQLEALAFSIAQLLQTLNREIQNGNIVPGRVSFEIINLQRIIADILSFVTAETGRSFLKLLFTSDDRVVAIETYHRRLAGCINAFQVSALINVREWQHRNDLGRVADQETLNRRLTELETNQSRLAEALDIHHNSIVAMMITFQKLITKRLSGERERQFFSHTLDYLSTISGKHVELEGWMVTSYEVDFGPEIGSGGFGKVFRGKWNRTKVALKVLKTETGATPSSSLISQEIRTWMNLRHPHILQFLGANVFDDRPFIMMQYLKNGNARDYICEHPNCNRLTILHHICLGLVYLHANNVIHGDLKAVNILIDDAGNAVLCDFGLSGIKSDAASRSTNARTAVTGSRNWMSPERMLGGPLRKPVDIYAFGMTVYEILTGEVPLGDIPYLNFIQLVVKEHTRPKRPEDDCYDISDGLWSLAEACWSAEPTQRPTAEGICDAMESLSNPTIQSWTPLSLPKPLQTTRSSTTQGPRQVRSATPVAGPSTIRSSPNDALRPWTTQSSPPIASPAKRSPRIGGPPFSKPVYNSPSTPPRDTLHLFRPSTGDSSNSNISPVNDGLRTAGPPKSSAPPFLRTPSSSSPRDFFPSIPILASSSSHSTQSSTSDILHTPGRSSNEQVCTTPPEMEEMSVHQLDTTLQSTHTGSGTQPLVDSVRPSKVHKKPSRMASIFTRPAANAQTQAVSPPIYEGSGFRIDAPEHPLPMCRNPIIEKWTIDDFLERWIIRSPDISKDLEFQDVFLASFPAFSDCNTVYEGLLSLYNAAETIKSAQDRVTRRQSILSGMVYWVESPFMPANQEVQVQMKSFANTIPTFSFMYEKATWIPDTIERKERERPRVILPTNRPHVSLRKLLDGGPEEIAATLTVIEGMMYRCIHPADYIMHLRNIPGPDRVAEACRMTNKITHWVMWEMLRHDQIRQRGEVLKLFLAAANLCWQGRNFSSATAIIRALNSGVIQRLRETFGELEGKEKRLLGRLSDLVKSEEAYRKIVSSASPEPCIPCSDFQLKHLNAVLPSCFPKTDKECTNWVNIMGCKALAKRMSEIAKLKAPSMNSSADDAERLTYILHLTSVKMDGKEVVVELETRSLALAEGEKKPRAWRATVFEDAGFKLNSLTHLPDIQVHKQTSSTSGVPKENGQYSRTSLEDEIFKPEVVISWPEKGMNSCSILPSASEDIVNIEDQWKGGCILSVHDSGSADAWIDRHYEHYFLSTLRENGIGGPVASMLSFDVPALTIYGSASPQLIKAAEELARFSHFPVIIRPSTEDPSAYFQSHGSSFGDAGIKNGQASSSSGSSPQHSKHPPGGDAPPDEQPEGNDDWGDPPDPDPGPPSNPGTDPRHGDITHDTNIRLNILFDGKDKECFLEFETGIMFYPVPNQKERLGAAKNTYQPSKPTIEANVIRLKMRTKHVLVDHAAGALGFLTRDRTFFRFTDYVSLGYDEPGKIFKHSMSSDHATNFNAVASMKQVMPMLVVGYNHAKSTMAESVDDRPSPAWVVEPEPTNEHWNSTIGHSALNVNIYRRPLDPTFIQHKGLLDVKYGMSVQVAAPIEKSASKVSFVYRHQIQCWVTTRPMRPRGIIVIAAHYIPDMCVDSSSWIQERCIMDLGRNGSEGSSRAKVTVPDCENSESKKNSEAFAFGTATTPEEAPWLQSLRNLKMLAKAQKSEEAAIPVQTHTLWGWDSTNEEWKKVVWPRLDCSLKPLKGNSTAAWRLDWRVGKKTADATPSLQGLSANLHAETGVASNRQTQGTAPLKTMIKPDKGKGKEVIREERTNAIRRTHSL